MTGFPLPRLSTLLAIPLLAACGPEKPEDTAAPRPEETGDPTETGAEDSSGQPDTATDTSPADTATETGDTEPGDTATETGDTEPGDTATETGDTEPGDTATETGDTDPDDTATETGDTAPATAFAGVVEVRSVATAETGGRVADGRIGSIDNLSVLGDVTGDGLDDTVIGSPFHAPGTVLVLPDASVWTGDADADAVVTIEGTEELGFVPLSMNDATGDGLDDLLVGDRSADGVGVAYVFAGPLSGSYADTDATQTVTGEWASAEWGEAIDAGDLDGDGVNELVVGGAESGAGYVGVYPAGAGAFTASDGALTTGTTSGDDFGATVVVGDIDADGYADVLVGAPGVDTAATDAGAVYGLPGSATGVGAAAWTFLGPVSAGAWFGTNSRGIARPADLDGSGAPDVALAAYWYGAVAVYTDAARGTYAWTDADTLIEERGSDAGSSLVSGDLDEDGDADLLIGCYADDTWARDGGTAWIFLDLPTGTLGRGDASAELYAADANQYLGTAVGTRDGSLFLVASWRDTTVSRGGVLYQVDPW